MRHPSRSWRDSGGERWCGGAVLERSKQLVFNVKEGLLQWEVVFVHETQKRDGCADAVKILFAALNQKPGMLLDGCSLSRVDSGCLR